MKHLLPIALCSCIHASPTIIDPNEPGGEPEGQTSSAQTYTTTDPLVDLANRLSIRVVDDAEAARYSQQQAFVTAVNDDEQAAVVKFLVDAEHREAVAVSRLTIHHMLRDGDTSMACLVQLGPDVQTDRKVIVESGPLITHTERVPVTRSRNEMQQECSWHSEPVTRYHTRYDSEYDSFTKSYRSVPRTETVTEYEQRNECRMVPHTVTATEFETRTTQERGPSSYHMQVSHTLDLHRDTACVPADTVDPRGKLWVSGVLLFPR